MQQRWHNWWMPVLGVVLAFGMAVGVGAQRSAGRIAFAATGGHGVSTIYTILPDGSGLRRVVTDGRDPAFTVDGRLLFVRGRDIYTVSSTGTHLTRLTRHGLGVTVGNPVMSEDRSIVLYTTAPVTRNPVTRLGLLRLDGSGERMLSPGMDPGFTPDQVRIVYANAGAVYSMSRNSMAGAPYTPGVMYQPPARVQVRYPVMGPGNYNGFVYNARPTGSTRARWNLMAVTYGPNGPRERLLARNATQPAFSADGRNLAFVRDSRLYVMRADGSNPRALPARVGPISHPSWWSPRPR